MYTIFPELIIVTHPKNTKNLDSLYFDIGAAEKLEWEDKKCDALIAHLKCGNYHRIFFEDDEERERFLQKLAQIRNVINAVVKV